MLSYRRGSIQLFSAHHDGVRSNRNSFLSMSLSLTFLVLAGCNISGKATVDFKIPTGPDFKRSVIISSGPVAADGVSPLLVVVDLLNSDGTPVVLFTPTYEIQSGLGVVASECTPSNTNGAATCILKSLQPGVKHLAVTNVKIALEKDLTFTSPSGAPSLNIVGAASSTTLASAQGDSAQIKIGTTIPNKKISTQDGYSIQFGLKPTLNAR